jgi:chromosome segregation ATPase
MALRTILIVGFASLAVATRNVAVNTHSSVQTETAAEKARDSVISKVIEMLGENQDKIVADIASESKEMAEYFEWCDDEQKETSYSIRTAVRKIEEQTAIIQDRTAQIHSLDEDIANLATEITERNTEMDEANALRKKQLDDFKANEAEQMAMVEELEMMEQELKRQMEAMTTPPPVPVEGEEGAEAEAAPPPVLLQKHEGDQQKSKDKKKTHSGVSINTLRKALETMVDAVWVDPKSKRALGVVHGLLQQQVSDGQDPEATPAPTVEVGAEAFGAMQDNTANNMAAFEMLKGKAEESLQRMRDAEVTEKANHDLRIQSLKAAIHLSNDNMDDAKRDKTRVEEEKGEAEGEVAKCEETKAAAEKYLASVTGECDKASASWGARQKGAKEETAAIQKAKEILSARVTVFVQSKAHGMVKQPVDVRKQETQIAKVRQSLVNHFRKLGNDLHSLAMLNLVSVSTEEPLAQVKGLIGELIAKLEKEAAEAASLHQFCKEEKVKTTAAKTKKQNTIDKLDARLDKAITKQTDLKEAVAELSQEIKELDEGDAEATKIRTEQHASNTKAIADFKGAADAVSDAIDALKDYYGSFLQTSDVTVKTVGAKAPPKLGGAKSDAAGGILSIMDTMQGEFEKTASELGSDEREAAKAFDTLMQEHKVSKAAKAAEIKGDESEIKSLSVAIHNFQEDHKMASNELASILEYVEKLKPQCEGRTVPYAERKAKREAEIQGLKDALAILQSDAPTFLQIRKY